MRIEAHDHLGNPIKTTVTRVVIYDDFNHPVSVAVKHREGWLYVGHCRDPEFFDFLKLLGIEQTFIVDQLEVNGNRQRKVVDG
jgi:hypothetical protein